MPVLEKIMADAGVFEYGAVNTAQVRFLPEVRAMCEVNTCQKYGTTWACPPAVGTVEECRDRVRQFEKLVVFSVKYGLEDSFDYEGMVAGGSQFQKTCRAVDRGLRALGAPCLVLGNEGCDRCKKCTYPNAPCRFPEVADCSLEGFGILVSEVARQAGVAYNNGPNTVTYFGAVACHPDLLEA